MPHLDIPSRNYDKYSGIDQNPGLKSKSSQSLSICERKLNNTSSLAFQKISVLSN